ncbi:MAG: AAA family ATPase [Gemmatimonadaceae bacterium]
MTDWRLFRSAEGPRPDWRNERPEAPPWRQFATIASTRAETFEPPKGVIEAVNAALYLRRPILVTGDPGTGKSSLAYAVAYELELGKVLTWHINSRSTLLEGLYDYDALARLRDANLQRLSLDRPAGDVPQSGTTLAPPKPEDIGRFITLGAIGTAFLAPPREPRVVLIDEIDKSDVDLPNDLLHVFEDGMFVIPELARIADHSPEIRVRTQDPDRMATVQKGVITCREFPIVVITSNGERDLPPAFLRRCLRIDLPRPGPDMLRAIVTRHIPGKDMALLEELLGKFEEKRNQGGMLATDQLLNAFYLVTRGREFTPDDRAAIEAIVLRELDAR